MSIFIPNESTRTSRSIELPEIAWGRLGTESLRICTVFDDNALSGNQLRNIADQSAPATIGGTAYTADPLRTTVGLDRGIEIHPSGGVYGIDNPLYPDVADSGDITMLWFGQLQSTNSTHACFGWRSVGADSFRLNLSSPTNFRVSYIDSSPAQYNADVTIATASVGEVFCFVGRKKGNTIAAFAKKLGGGISQSSTTGGTGTFRDDGAGNKISPANTNAGKGHQITSLFYVWDDGLSDELIDRIIDNPYQILKPRKTYFLLDTGAAPVTTETFNAAQRTDRGYGPQHALTLGGLLQ